MTPRTSIVIPVRNQLALTRQCLEAVTTEYGGREDIGVVVVDDGSTDETPSFLEGVGEIEVVRHESSLGFAASCNDGANIGSADYLVFLNNDTVGKEGWCEALIAYAKANPAAAIVGARLLYPNETIQHAGIVLGSDLIPRHVYRGFPAEHPAVKRSRPFRAVTAACVLIRRGVFEEVGGFDTEFTNGFDDIDLCLRIAERGREVHYCAESVLVHLEAATRGEDADLFRRNAERYLERWGHRVRRDDIDTYLADGLLEIVPGDLYPLELRVSARLANVAGSNPYELLEERSRQVFDLLKENAELQARLRQRRLEAETRTIST